MLVSWYCGCYTGPSKLHGDVFEPDECSATGQLEVDEDVWNDGDVAIICSRCGNTLTQYMDHFSEIK